VLFVFMWVGMVLVGGVAQLWLGFAANAVLTECLVILAPVYLLVRKLGLRKALGLQRPPDSGTLLWALLGVLALAVLIAEFTHWSDRVFPMPESIKAAYLEAVTAESLPELLLLLIAAGCVPGFCEEAAFRGFFQQVGVARLGRHGGIALAASLFAVMHLDPWHLVALFFIGLYLGYLFAWTANLWIPAAAHAANNAVSVLLLYVDPQTGLSQMSEPPPRWLLPLAVAALVIALVRIRRSDSGPNRVALARQSGVESQDSVCG
jgi:membrane protease YdiL (CAAX protease family)